MLTVKKFNKISDVIYTQMAADKYNFVEDGDNYDVALVRSTELHDTVFPAELLAIARAGAGTKSAASIVKGDGAAALQALNGAQQIYTGTRGGYAYVMADFAEGAEAAAEALKGIDGVLRVRVIG